MSFARALAAKNPKRKEGRRYLFVPYDQLSSAMGPLSREPASELGIVLLESREKAGRRPYHRHKLAFVLANLRHFALEQAARGVHVVHVASEHGYARALREVVPTVGPLRVQEPAEYELRHELSPLIAEKKLVVVPHEGWLSTEADFAESCPSPQFRMDAFYKHMRKRTGILMNGTKPEGGAFSFDAENRKPWKGEPPAPERPTFPVDDVKREVKELVDRVFHGHPGTVDLEHLPASREDAETAWAFAKGQVLEQFGPYEDAMSVRSSTLFHTRISALLNVHRILPKRVVEEAAASDAKLASREGFVRQVLGWREFVRHVHRISQGFRDLSCSGREVTERPATPSFLGASGPLPPVFWGAAESGLHCLDHVVRDVWREAYGHHITRLMVIANLATLLDLSPRELTDWFWVAYDDAYDWVVEPNVLGMGTYAAGPLMTTKPYISGAAYIAKMSDYCKSCAFDPKSTCPITRLYWSFLDRHESALAGPRMAVPLVALRKRSPEDRKKDRETFRWVVETLATGKKLVPQEKSGSLFR